MYNQTFVTLAYPGHSVLSTLMLISSIREFGGALADSPVWVLFPESLGDFSENEHVKFKDLDVKLIPYDVEDHALKFPFAARVQAAAIAEEMSLGKTELLTWLDSDTLVITEPKELMLSPDKALGYRPVHHKLLGLAWDEQPDSFWALIYQHCQASPQKEFPMMTHVGEKIRPYFNAGIFVVRPENGLLTRWWQVFQSCYQLPNFLPFYEKNSLYAIFMHQAVFTGVLLNMLDPAEMQELRPNINYPLHLHQDIPLDLRANHIDDLVTVRYEKIFNEPGWQKELPISDQLAGWIKNHQHMAGDDK